MRSSCVIALSATLSGAVLAAAGGCGNRGGGGAPADGGSLPPDTAPPDASPDGSGTPPDGSPDAPPDGGDACGVAWHDVQIGGELDDQIWGLASDGHQLYAAGYEHGVTGVENIEPSGDSRGVILQLDPSGAVAWKTTFDTPGSDTVEGLALDAASGAVYAVGRTSGAFDGFTNQGQFDMFLAVLDARGRNRRLVQIGDDRPQHPTRIGLGPNGALAVAGSDDMFVEENALIARQKGFIASFVRGPSLTSELTESFLQKVELPTPTGGVANSMTDVVIDRDGSGVMYVTSRSDRGARAVPGIFVAKLNADGTTAWRTQISSIPVDAATAVALSADNALFVTGATQATLGSASFGQQDAFVAKVDKATGAIVWTAQAGTADADFPTALAFDRAGNIYSAGHTLIVDPKDPTRNTLTPFVMKFDIGGTLVGTWRAPSVGDTWVTSMVVDACDHVYIAGYTKLSLIPGTSATAGGYDMFVLRATL